MKTLIGLTMGDPAGVGPEIVLKALRHPWVKKNCRSIVYGDARFLKSTGGAFLKSRFSIQKLLQDTRIVDLKNIKPKAVKNGVPSKAGGQASGDYIKAAVVDAKAGHIQALVTAPINKVSFRMGGWGKQFVGHTEMLARLTQSKSFALMLVCGNVRAVHVTSHVPLRMVSSLITKKRVADTIKLAHHGLKLMGFQFPRIAVCALNPHAGEDGLLGDEEQKKIEPAIQACRRSGLNVKGPFPSDSLWPQVNNKIFDIGVAMYHDQGQIPVKFCGFKFQQDRSINARQPVIIRGVNVTLGLPFIRTSVDHGTAYDIAGKGIASEHSLVDAIKLAVDMVHRRRGHG